MPNVQLPGHFIGQDALTRAEAGLLACSGRSSAPKQHEGPTSDYLGSLVPGRFKEAAGVVVDQKCPP